MSSWALRNLVLFLSPSGDVSITPDAGSVVLTGQTPTLTPTFITPSAGTVVITGQAATLFTGSITPDAGTLTLTGQLATVSTGEITPGTGSLTLTGQTPTVSGGANVSITPGTAIDATPTQATLLWFSGCETGGPVGGFGSEFSALSNGGGGTPTFQTLTKRTGSYGLLTPHDGYARIKINYGSNATTFLRKYFRVTSNPTNTVPIILAANTTSASARGFRLFLTSTGKIGWDFNALGGGSPAASGADSVSLTDWNFLEVKFVRDATVGGMEIYLNGVLQVSSFATSTTSGTSLTTTTVFMGNDLDQPGTNRSGIDIWWDDMAFGIDAYIGPGQCLAFQGKAGTPTYDAWTKNGGATSAADAWSETPWSGTKNCSDAVIGDRQTMFVDDAAIISAIPAAAINGAMILAVAKIVTSGNFKLTRRLNGVDTDSATKTLSTTDTMEPNGVNGDSMDVFKPTYGDLTGGTLEIGAVANSTNTVTVEDMWLMIDYRPAGLASITVTGAAPIVSSSTSPNLTPGTGSVVITGRQPSLAIVGPLLIQWNDLSPLSAILPLLWNVVSPGPVGQLPIQWDVVETPTPLQLTWRVIPNLRPTFDATIQKPVATIVETP